MAEKKPVPKPAPSREQPLPDQKERRDLPFSDQPSPEWPLHEPPIVPESPPKKDK